MIFTYGINDMEDTLFAIAILLCLIGMAYQLTRHIINERGRRQKPIHTGVYHIVTRSIDGKRELVEFALTKELGK